MNKISAKEAVKIAKEHMADILEIKASDIEVEEVFISEEKDGPTWNVTLSRVKPARNFASAAAGGEVDYKVIEINASSGEVGDMTIRKI